MATPINEAEVDHAIVDRNLMRRRPPVRGVRRVWVAAAVWLAFSTAVAQEGADAAQNEPIVAALLSPGMELEIVPDAAKVKAAGLTTEAIREACDGRRFGHNVYRVRINGAWVNLEKIAAVRKRPLASTPFSVDLPDGRKARVTLIAKEVGKYCITSRDFEDFVRDELTDLFVEEPGDAYVLGMLPVPGGVLPHLTSLKDFAHYSVAVPLQSVARVEVTGKAGPQLVMLGRLRAARKALEDSLTVYEGWSRSEFESLFGKGEPPQSAKEDGEDGTERTRIYALGPERLQAFFEKGRIEELLVLTADPKAADVVKVEETYRAMLIAFLETVYRGTGERGRAELQRFFTDTPAVHWSTKERNQLIEAAGQAAAGSSDTWKPRAALAGTARERRPDGIRIGRAKRVDFGDSVGPSADQRIAAVNDLSRVEKLEFDLFGVTDAGLARLAEAGQLHELDLRYCREFTAVGLGYLKGLAQLEYLDLEGSAVTDEGLAHLSGLTALWVLKLGNTAVTGAGAAHLNRMRQLREMWLPSSAVTDAVLAQIKQWPDLYTLNEYGAVTSAEEWARLRREGAAAVPKGLWLNLSDSKVTDAGLAHLAGNTRLCKLDLADTEVTDAGLRRLKGLSELRELTLSWTRATGAGLAEVRDETNLEVLRLNYSRASDDGLVGLATLSGLAWLELDGTDVTDAGLKHLAGLTRLRELSLSETNVTGQGLEHLARLKELTSLDLSETPLSDAGLAWLPPLPRLTMLRLAGTCITDAGQAILQGGTRATANPAQAKMSDVAVARLAALPALQTVNVCGTPISKAGVDLLRSALPGVKVENDFEAGERGPLAH